MSSSDAPPTIDVVTYHNDLARTGQNLQETVLTTSIVQFGHASHFGTPMIANGKVYVGTTSNITALAGKIAE